MSEDAKKDLDNIKRESQKRINWIIQEFCDGSQQRFVEKTGLNKGSVSQYVNGKKTPTNLAAQKIGEAFKLPAAWIMGFEHVTPPPFWINKEENIASSLIIHEFEKDKYLKCIFEKVANDKALQQLVEVASNANPKDIQLVIDLLLRLIKCDPES